MQDIPPYTIVGGVPAKPIRKRFDDETIAALLKIKWWDWSEEKIVQNIPAIQSGLLRAELIRDYRTEQLQVEKYEEINKAQL